MKAGSAVPTRSYTYDGATPQSLATFLLRECREHFCAYGHCKRALSKGPLTLAWDPAACRWTLRPGGVGAGWAGRAAGDPTRRSGGGGASPDEFCYS